MYWMGAKPPVKPPTEDTVTMLPRRGPSFFFMALQANAPETLHATQALQGERKEVCVGLACVKARRATRTWQHV